MTRRTRESMSGAVAVHTEQQQDHPTEERPESGVVTVEEVVISSALRWIAEDGAHVIDSTEFQLTGMGEDWDSAIDSFWLSANDLFEYMAELTTEERSDEETMLAATLGPRLVQAWERSATRWRELAKEIQSRRTSLLTALNFRRRELVITDRGQSSWRPDRLMQSSSERPLPV
jgi:hypothetical protein